MFNYQEIVEDLLSDIPARAKEILIRRFGLGGEKRETLQAIGQNLVITRERVRQIENAGLFKVKEKIRRHEPVFQFFLNQLKTSGNLRKEDVLIKILSPQAKENEVFFLLNLEDKLQRQLADKNLHTSWISDKNSLKLAQKTIKEIVKKMKNYSRPFGFEEILSFSNIDISALFSFMEASQEIEKGPQGLWGLKVWPEIKPRGAKDKAYIIFQKEKRPIHFKEVAGLINENNFFKTTKNAQSQTVHNELIKDPRFVLIGRGMYALKEWGYEPGAVKDVILKVLKQRISP